MTKNLLLSIFSILFLASCFQTPVKPENLDHEIMKTIQNYFDGRRNADIDLLKTSFIPNANLETLTTDGEVQKISFESYLDVVSKKGKVEVKTQVMYLSISNTIAIAQTRFDYGDKIYLDYLTLLKTNQGWRISNKAFVKL